MVLVDYHGVHDSVGADVRKWVQQNRVDEREHRRGGTNAEREGEYSDNGEATVPAPRAEAIADVTPQLI